MRNWAGFVTAFLITAVCGATAIWLFTLLSDPYDTGRFSAFGGRPLSSISSRMAVASLGRNQQFNAVIVGNSHAAPISPHRLSKSTGLEFVSLTLPGASTEAEMLALKWFLKNQGARTRAIVVGVDDVWCRSFPRYVEEPVLPTWLISESPFSYAAGLFRYDSVEQAFQSFINPARATARPPDPRGFWDLELDYNWDAEKVGRELAKPWIDSINLTGRYPALQMLDRALDAAPEDAAVALVMLPVWAPIIPKEGPALASEEACKRAFAEFISRRKRGMLIDGKTASDLTNDPNNFFDRTHYRRPVAQEIENELKQRLGT